MLFVTSTENPASLDGDLLVLGVPDGKLADSLSALGQENAARFASAAKDDEFSGKAGSSALYPSFGAARAGRVLLLGLGAGSVDDLRRAAGLAGSMARARGATSVLLSLGDLDAARAVAVVESFGTGNYRFEKYKSDADRRAAAAKVTLVGQVDSGALDLARAVLAGQILARDLVNDGPDQIYPETLASAAAELAGDGLSVEVWDENQIKAAGMNGIMAVGRGSSKSPRFVHMIWKPAGKSTAKLAIIGKGVTFDSGGLSLKPSASMQTMRCDMAGSAAVIGLMRACKDLRPDVEVHGIFGAVENMTGADAYKLGDVLRMLNGKTVEIHNTDAEGRLVLADCLVYASKLGADAMVDLATLTGACVVALGEQYSGLFTADDGLANTLLGHAAAAGEGMWRLPLSELYKDKIKADWGSLKNTGGREAGAITAALFLAEFVSDTRWAHIDIAGPAFMDKPWRHFAAGGTGHMVATLARWVTAGGQ